MKELLLIVVGFVLGVTIGVDGITDIASKVVELFA